MKRTFENKLEPNIKIEFNLQALKTSIFAKESFPQKRLNIPAMFFCKIHPSVCTVPQLFLERERAAILAEAKTDDLISEAPKPALDQSGEWQETSGEIQWVASETNDNQPEKKEEEEEELDLNKGGFTQTPNIDKGFYFS